MSVIKRQTILGTIYSYLGVMVGTITMGLIVPNYFTIEENGLINLLSKWSLVLVIVISLGFNYAGNRFFKFFRSAEEGYKGYLFNGLSILAIGSILVIAFIYLFKGSIISSDGSDNALFIKYFYLIIPLTISTGVFNLFDNYAKNLYDTVAGTFLSQFLQRLLALVAVVLYVTDYFTFNQFIIAWVVGMSLPSVFMIIHSIRLGSFSLKPSNFLWKSDFKEEFFRFAGFSVVTGLSATIVMALDTMMVYKFLGLGLSGIYSFCLLFGSVMTMAYNANVKASTPIITDALQNNDTAKIQQIFIKSGLTQLMFGTVLLVLVWVSIDNVFSLVKPEYLIGKTALIIIGISKLYDLASGINAIILAYSKYYKYDSFLVVSFIGLLYGLNHYMIPAFGLEGAAYAALIATVYYNSLRNYLIWKFFKIHPYTFGQLKILVVGLIVLGIGLLLPDFEGNNLFSMIYKSSILSVLFAISFYYLRISVDINDVLDKLFKKVLGK